MMEQERNRLTKRRLKIKHRRERRQKIVTVLISFCFTALLACVIGLFSRHLLLQRALGEVQVMAETPVNTEPSLAAAGVVAETEAETAAVPKWSAEELTDLRLVYKVFIHGRGWNLPHRDNSFCMAAAGEYLTAMNIRMENQPEGMTGTIEYSVNISGDGWRDWIGNGGIAGVTDTDQPMESFRVRFSGELGEYYDLYYSVLQDNVWGGWVKNGEDAGTAAAGKRVEGIRVSSIKKAESDTAFPGQVDPSRPMIALTYDDGPSRMTTPKILEALARYDARATFFMVGNRVPEYHDIVRQMQEQGSEVANHTMNHVAMREISDDAYAAQLMTANQAIVDACGVTPVLMRPCEGYVNASGMAVVGSLGMSGILWTVDTLDWKTRDTDKTVQAVLNEVKDGDIILMHDLYDSTAAASAIIIPELINQGYQLVTVSELASCRGGILPGQKYGSFR